MLTAGMQCASVCVRPRPAAQSAHLHAPGHLTQLSSQSSLARAQEVTNNWYPGEVLEDERYPAGTTADSLAATARQALYEYYPIPDDKPLYRQVSYGKHLDVFLADMRSYRRAPCSCTLTVHCC